MMVSRRLILSLDRRSHPDARLNWRWSDTTERFQQQPESSVEMVVFPCHVDLIMARAAAEIRLFFGLVRVEVATTVGRHAMDPAVVFFVQEKTGTVLASSRRQSPDPANLAAIHETAKKPGQTVQLENQ
jgi:hypothetical protein